MKKDFKRNAFKACTAMLLVFCFAAACRKPDIKKDESKEKLHTHNGQGSVTISMEEIYAQLPQSIMFNLASQIRIDVSPAEWRYESDYVMLRIPLNTATNQSFLYAVKTYANPTARPRVFLVEFINEAGSTKTDFTGKQMWLNLQDWNVYGMKYVHNIATEAMDPIGINPNWESTMVEAGLFYIDNNQIAVHDDPINPDAGAGMKPTGGRKLGDDLMGHGKGKGFWVWLTGGISDAISSVGNWLNGLGGGTSGGSNGGPPDGGGADGGGWGTGWPPDYGGGNSDPGPGWGGPPGGNSGGSSGGGSSTPPVEENPPIISIWDANLQTSLWASVDEPGSNYIPAWVNGISLNDAIESENAIFAIENPIVNFVGNALSLNGTQRGWLGSHLDKASSIKAFLVTYVPDLNVTDKNGVASDHLKWMMENPDYLNRINNLPGNWWEQDQNGFITARKIQMDIYTQIYPFGALDCNDITGLDNSHWTNWQGLSTYQIPAAVNQRVINTTVQFPSRYTMDAFHIQNINDASGAVVNCDFFALHIAELPFDSYGQVRMTSDQFLDYFRQNINSLDNLGNNTTTTYMYYNDPGYVNDYTPFYSSYESSIGTMARFHNPANITGQVAYNDGTVIESGFDRTTDHKWFVYSTIKTPADGQHPVSGNRRFGIQPDAVNGGYMFYLRGVDRTTDDFTSAVNSLFGTVFDGADELWNSEMKGVKNFIQQNGGSANLYPTGGVVFRRMEWEGTLGDFLKGEITFQELKTLNNCP